MVLCLIFQQQKTTLIISYMYFHGVYKSTIFHVIIFVCSLSINRHPNYSINLVHIISIENKLDYPISWSIYVDSIHKGL